MPMKKKKEMKINKRASDNKCYSLRLELFENEIMTRPTPRFFPAGQGWSTKRYLREESDEEKALPVAIIGKGKPKCQYCQSNKCSYAKGKQVILRFAEKGTVYSPAPFVILSATGEERHLDIAKCRKGPLYFLLESSPIRMKKSLTLKCVNCISPQLDILADAFGYTTVTCRHCGFIWVIDGVFPLTFVKKLVQKLPPQLKLTYEVGFVKEDQGSYLIRIKKDRA